MTSSDVTMVTALMPHTCVMAQSNAHTITTTEEMMSKDAVSIVALHVLGGLARALLDGYVSVTCPIRWSCERHVPH